MPKWKSWLVTARDVVMFLSAVLVPAALAVGLLQLSETQKQLNETIRANETAALADLMKTYYEAKNIFYTETKNVPDLPADILEEISGAIYTYRAIDYGNAIAFACLLRQDGRLDKYGNQFVDRVIRTDVEIYEDAAPRDLARLVARNACDWE